MRTSASKQSEAPDGVGRTARHKAADVLWLVQAPCDCQWDVGGLKMCGCDQEEQHCGSSIGRPTERPAAAPIAYHEGKDDNPWHSKPTSSFARLAQHAMPRPVEYDQSPRTLALKPKQKISGQLHDWLEAEISHITLRQACHSGLVLNVLLLGMSVPPVSITPQSNDVNGVGRSRLLRLRHQLINKMQMQWLNAGASSLGKASVLLTFDDQ
ncbi:predicted protein [Histoplasma capsulatum H143]|uniref:Uncharacterized protein n=1 Tax=Ajellomyces capsulatus (strain H143) TaxID=544712 RepID=C6HH58_AJECH|nr:predicted protein [Histoplasma capsulatum H143]